MTAPLDRVLMLFTNLTRNRRGWSARCPAHADRQNSLSLALGDDGRLLVHCFAGCQPEAIVAAIGLQLRDLYPDAGSRRRAAATDYLSPLDEARRTTLAGERRAQARRDSFRPLMLGADRFRITMLVVHEARGVACKVGPDHPRVWELLECAAHAERLAHADLAEVA